MAKLDILSRGFYSQLDSIWIIPFVRAKQVPTSLVSTDEIRTMITVGHKEGTVEEGEADLLHAVFEFGDNPVSEVLVPRLEVIGVEKGSTITEFLAIYAENPMSRFPVYVENMDNIVGILSIKDVLMAQAKGTATPKALSMT